MANSTPHQFSVPRAAPNADIAADDDAPVSPAAVSSPVRLAYMVDDDAAKRQASPNRFVDGVSSPPKNRRKTLPSPRLLLIEDILRIVAQYLTVKEVVQSVGMLDSCRQSMLPKILPRQYLVYLGYLYDRVELADILPFSPKQDLFIPASATLVVKWFAHLFPQAGDITIDVGLYGYQESRKFVQRLLVAINIISPGGNLKFIGIGSERVFASEQNIDYIFDIVNAAIDGGTVDNVFVQLGPCSDTHHDHGGDRFFNCDRCKMLIQTINATQIISGIIFSGPQNIDDVEEDQDNNPDQYSYSYDLFCIGDYPGADPNEFGYPSPIIAAPFVYFTQSRRAYEQFPTLIFKWKAGLNIVRLLTFTAIDSDFDFIDGGGGGDNDYVMVRVVSSSTDDLHQRRNIIDFVRKLLFLDHISGHDVLDILTGNLHRELLQACPIDIDQRAYNLFWSPMYILCPSVVKLYEDITGTLPQAGSLYKYPPEASLSVAMGLGNGLISKAYYNYPVDEVSLTLLKTSSEIIKSLYEQPDFRSTSTVQFELLVVHNVTETLWQLMEKGIANINLIQPLIEKLQENASNNTATAMFSRCNDRYPQVYRNPH